MARSPDNNYINAIVKQVRSQTRASIIKQCGTMQVLDMIQPIGLNDIYVNVNILETILGRRRLSITELLESNKPEQFNRWGLSKITEERVAGLTAVEKYSKLIVLGKPGSGKTTFLKYLAIQCSLGKFQVNKFPIFIAIKDFAEAKTPTLLVYITQIMQNCGVNKKQLIQLLQHGRAIILLDGLDEIRQEDSQQIIQKIYNFSIQFNQNNFVLTCRIAVQEYNLNNFQEVEIADFDFQQISSFASKWFANADPIKSDKFIQKLQENESIQELANNPLLLTLLCLMFQETAEFPWNRLELYQEGINLLLKKWDAKKNIERSQVYKKLSNQQKQDLLSQIASINFEQNKYFFKQQELEQCIADYISNLVSVNTEAEEFKIDVLNVIKAIELQHGLLVERARGIYSFSHLTFQEYFTARQISICSHPQILERSLQKLVSRTIDKRWHEIFLLTVGMLRNANYLLQLMKKKVDWIVAGDRQLQEFLAWANYKSQIVDTPYNKGALRAFYIALGITLYLVKQTNDTALDLASDTLELAFTLDPAFILNRSVAIDLVMDKALVVMLARAINLKLDFTQAGELVSVLNFSIKLTLEPKLKHNEQSSVLCQRLVDLQQQLPNLEPQAQFEQWWQSNGTNWIEHLRSVMINQRQIGYDWQLGDRQKETLRLYYYANQLLLDCLKEDCYITRDVRSHIEETLLLPVIQLAQPEF